MMTTKTKPVNLVDPLAPRHAVIGVESGVEIAAFHKHSSAFDFAEWHNQREAMAS